MKTKGRILTGHRPTGPRHLGHLVGTLETWARLQDDHECFFLIADLHVLTTVHGSRRLPEFAPANSSESAAFAAHPGRLGANVLDTLADWLAAGVDPERATLVLQSALPEHAELSLLLGMLVSVGRLERVPTYKEQARELNLTPSLGLLSYPVLQAADILIYQAAAVPVGEDQLPHLELARELARRFNGLYGQTFPEPQALLSPAPRLPGLDNRAMHTSYGNAIYLKDTPEETERKVMSMYTDPQRLHASDPGTVEGNPVFAYLDLFDPDEEEVADLKARYRAGKVGDVEVKRRLAAALNERLAPLRARRAGLIAHPSRLRALLLDGTQTARPIVQETLREVQEKMGLLMPQVSTGRFEPRRALQGTERSPLGFI